MFFIFVLVVQDECSTITKDLWETDSGDYAIHLQNKC